MSCEKQIEAGLSKTQVAQKRFFDFLVAFIVLCSAWWLILLCWVFASLETRSNGFFVQDRVGRHGRVFKLIKIKTMKPSSTYDTSVTTSNDPRISITGAFFRRTKLDELPQFWNVLTGEMSLVGPRPDVPGFADLLTGSDAAILLMRPGITGPATLKYRDEERLLASVSDAEAFNREEIWPDKIRINLEYMRNWSFETDLRILSKTLVNKC